MHRNDKRFEVIHADPKFSALRRKERKVVIDRRFAGALKDPRFQTTDIDRRGRKRKQDTGLADVYDVEEEEKGEDEKEVEASEGEEEGDEADEEREEEGDEEGEAGNSETEENEEESDGHVDPRSFKMDLARGDGNLSSSDDEDENEDEEEEEKEHKWGELDRDARRVEWASSRLAICNLDWDHVSADDILLLVSSFKPLGGKLEKLTVYMSDIGKEELQKEQLQGPSLDIEKDENNESARQDAIRRYQLERLKYYYAVLECDSEQTASMIYDQCDGVEYEDSGLRLDLRFVPDDMAFDETRIRDTATSDSVSIEKYKPKAVDGSALTKSRVKLQWDETDSNRKKQLSGAFRENADLDSLANELVADSDEEEDSGEQMSCKEKLRFLLGEDEKKESDMIVEWEDAPVKKQKEKKSTFEEYVEKRKAKKRERKQKIKESKNKGAAPEEQVEVDSRFSSLLTDPAFAIDQSSALSKKSKLVKKQREGAKRVRLEAMDSTGSSLLANKLKNKLANWK